MAATSLHQPVVSFPDYLQSCGIPVNRRSFSIILLGVRGECPEVLCKLTDVVVVIGTLLHTIL